jgi:peptide/nickel transport system substrate-binding protein
MLAEQVKAGKLPPVKERIPQEPLVIKPVKEIGKYGGTWRRGFLGAGDGENANRINAWDKPLWWDYTGTKIQPNVAREWKVSEDGRKTTLSLRKGMRWSDGAPFTADDWVFWYEELYSNRDIVKVPIAEMAANGKQGKVVKIDDYTVEFQFEDPNFLFVDLLAGDTLIGGGQSVRQSQGATYGGYAPAHYLRQFIPGKDLTVEQANENAKKANFDDWVRYLNFKKDWQLNPEVPVLGPFRMVTPINTPTWTLERNPYFYAVDTAGNQLPYVDRVVLTLAENAQVLNLRAAAGEFDLQERHTSLPNLPVLLENQEKGGFKVHIDLAIHGADAVIFMNQSFEADPEISKWLRNVDFRRALSMALDRGQLNETFWLGLGTPGSIAPSPSSPYSPGKEYNTMWSTLDLEKANKMLDDIGLSKKDAEGYRLRTDNGERLRFEFQSTSALLDYPKIVEMIAAQWRKAGIFIDLKVLERTAAVTRTRNNEHHFMMWTNGGTELLYLFPRHALPVDPTEAFFGPEYATWYVTAGKEGKEPKDPNIVKVLELFRSANGQTEAERIKTAQEIWKILVDQQFMIGTVGQSPAQFGVRVVSTKLGNIPARVCIAQHCRTPAVMGVQMFFK